MHYLIYFFYLKLLAIQFQYGTSPLVVQYNTIPMPCSEIMFYYNILYRLTLYQPTLLLIGLVNYYFFYFSFTISRHLFVMGYKEPVGKRILNSEAV